MTVENINETSYGPSQILNNTSRTLRTTSANASASPSQQLLIDDDCCYRLRTLKITTEDGRVWEIFHWQYLAWGDHGKDKDYFIY